MSVYSGPSSRVIALGALAAGVAKAILYSFTVVYVYVSQQHGEEKETGAETQKETI